MKVKEIMSTDVQVAEVPGTVEEVFGLFKNGQHSGLPVLKEGSNKVVGMITRSDLLKNPQEDQIAMLMTRDPVVIQEDAELEEAAKLILRHDIRRLPVVKDGELTGLVSVADLVGVLPDMDIDGGVTEYANGHCTSSWVNTPVPIIAEIMRLSNADSIPLLDDDCKVGGIISDTDLVKAFEIEESLEKSDMGAASDENEWTWDGVRDTMKFYYGVSMLKLPRVPVKEIMTSDVVTVYLGADIADCARKMARNQIEQIPILDEDENLIGLLRDRDMIKAFL
ncbi:CBS domain-containing protein [Methanonatronarchaeum sp. AMET6-2]|uniref:CBS domain-containing protein n=1 Tax=Methanonatronarchaeum sp. AMET6-2 TaxID=2933293 RepID=UPI00122844AC|nr:CBS domain-containing protein [Methanonatronarchaeum sp. AMET6-2]RZN61863.1 MAG: CBS domain-containing protein [Methanonatronarchaeia archaeon]UOY10233.1 CBS domain-containing protein [Methanonatronarchaeum sp. AMET6-2]